MTALKIILNPFHNHVECFWKWGKRCDSLLSNNPSSYHYAGKSTTTKQALLRAMHAFEILTCMKSRIVMFREVFQTNWRHWKVVYWILMPLRMREITKYSCTDFKTRSGEDPEFRVLQPLVLLTKQKDLFFSDWEKW